MAAVLVAAGVGASPYGICAHVAPDELLDAAASAGIGWVRIDFNWLFVEPEQDSFDWTIYDRLIPAARARGLRVFATLAYTPAWATDGSEWSGVPRDPGDWHDVCYRAAARYRGQVDAWGMWNEPNLNWFWEGTLREYVDLVLIPGSQAVRAADPGALVVGPDLAHLSSGSWDRWLEAILSEASDSLDVVSHHVYPSGPSHQDVTDKLATGGSYPWEPPSVRSILQRTGWLGRPFWLTETGFQSAPDGGYRQSVFYRDLLGDWFGGARSQAWLDRIFFYQLEDDPRFADQSWGIVTAAPDSTPKQAYFAYLNFIGNAVVDDAELLAADAPAALPPVTEASFQVSFRNTGTSTWSDADGYRLQTIDDACGMVVETGRIDPLRTVPPGASVTFPVRVRSSLWFPPRPPRQCVIGWRMAVADDPFGDELRSRIAVTEDPLPVIVSHPLSWAGPEHASLVLATVAAGAGELSYRWQRNGRDLVDDGRVEGAESAVLRISGLTAADGGEYRCIVGSPGGEIATRRAAVTVVSAAAAEVRVGGRRLTTGDPAAPPAVGSAHRRGGSRPLPAAGPR